jgi:hypothetical protein
LGAVDGEGAGGRSIHRLRTTPLDVADVLPLADGAGRRHLDTGYGRIAAHAGQAAAALEVMGGFALDPHWRRNLPPTMAPASVGGGRLPRAPDGNVRRPCCTAEPTMPGGLANQTVPRQIGSPAARSRHHFIQ